MSEAAWYLAQDGRQIGPMTVDELVAKLPGVAGPRTLIYGPGMANWAEAATVPAVAQKLGNLPLAPPMPPPPPGGRRSDQIDYEIFGSEMQFAEVTLDPGEMAIAEPGSMFFMTPGIQMATNFGDPSASGVGGIFSKLKTAGKRLLTGESMFITSYTNAGHQRETVAFAAPYPGKIVPLHLDQLGGEIICQKDSFLCAARGVQIGIAFQKKIGVALFGGEGFIMQRLTGDGIALVHAGGTMVKKTLRPGETLRVDTGCLVALARSVQYDIQFVGGIKSALFGGEGLFYAVLTGPGDIWLQSLPFSRLAGRMMAGAAGGKEEGSVLGGIGRFFDGDNS